MYDCKHAPIITDESPYPSPSLVLCLVCQEIVEGCGCAVSNDDLQSAVDVGILCDTLRYTCISCGKIDLHGCPVFEMVENGEKLMTGVICRSCQKCPLTIPPEFV